ncbi:hypothetical protein vB_AbaM_Acibel004_59 [Acinetobacter phage vB_AbaM_Acibel004]|uniref:hypothetical protein n=1 Tax=Acinetobacter phage vB_AbaM_Acibel004 TaxID=1481186 RepID=UPI0004E85F7E|nr:hypothetical protein vB_AbaM_Acibel004_59 [Acinetobacter phage vB_AbaM_Acibel004]AHY26674.1 hypothetical protein vB_AbaM_Acibel004_59 [Acinetobacter phage vB_AbaM_Acibel004]
MSKKKFNRVELEFPNNLHDGKLLATAYSEFGQGWQIPLRNMTPNDLRRIADEMELLGIEPDEFGGARKICQ